MPQYSTPYSKYTTSGRQTNSGWRCADDKNPKKPSKQKKITKTYCHNRFDLLDIDDSDTEHSSSKDLNNLEILKDFDFTTQPWGDISK